MAIRIGIDAREFTGGRRLTGIGRYLDNLVRPLLDDAGLKWIAFTHTPEHLPDTWQGIRTALLPNFPRLLVDQVILPGLAKRYGVDVFFSPYYKTPFTGRFRRIITVHDVMFLRLPEVPAWKRFLSAVQLRMACARADRILVDSAYTAADLGNLLPRRRDKMTVLYPSLEKTWATAVTMAETAATRDRFAAGHPYLLYVGNFKPHKNVTLLIEAFAGLCSKGMAQDYRLLLAGGDPVHRASIEARCRQPDCQDRVRICADVADTDLRSLYAAAQWTVTLSAYEGFGYPLVEAMASGCPVVCHPCTSLTELAQDCVLAVPELSLDAAQAALGEAIHMDATRRQTLIAKGRQNAKRFHDGSSARQFIALAQGMSSR